MLYGRLDTLVRVINEYYDADLRKRSRDFVTLESRDMFILLSTTEDYIYSYEVISKYLGVSISSIKKSKQRTKFLSNNDRFFKSRLRELKILLNKQV